jgi:hypothetical protein
MTNAYNIALQNLSGKVRENPGNENRIVDESQNLTCFGCQDKRMGKIIFRLLLCLQILSGSTFITAAWQADRVLDKSGMGDLEKFTFWNQLAGIGFYVFLLFWLCGVILLIIMRFRSRKNLFQVPSWAQSNLGVWLPLALLFSGWALAIF